MVAHTNDIAGVGNAAVQHLLIQHCTMLPRSDRAGVTRLSGANDEEPRIPYRCRLSTPVTARTSTAGRVCAASEPRSCASLVSTTCPVREATTIT